MKNETAILIHLMANGGRQLFGKNGYYWLEAEDPEDMRVVKVLLTAQFILPIDAVSIWNREKISLSFN